MIGRTLGRYFALHFLRVVVVVVLSIYMLVSAIDFVEQSRRTSDLPGAETLYVALFVAARTPAIIEQTLPFAVLIGAITSLLMLSRRSELVVARATGISAWQFLAPALVAATVIGLFAAMVYNPLATVLNEQARLVEGRLFGATSSEGARWMRQRDEGGQAIIGAAATTEGGRVLETVTVYRLDSTGALTERIDAARARLEGREWVIENAVSNSVGQRPVAHERLTIPTSFTPAQIVQRFRSPAFVSFWGLPAAISLANAAGQDASGYLVRWHMLAARPLLFVAMVLIAASVSLRLVRLGGAGPLIGGGVLAGFVLYVVSKITEDLGNAGLLGAEAAAWSPALIGFVAGMSMVLKREDG